MYSEPGTKIKVALVCRRKESPTVRIELPFDKLLFEGGIKACGTPSRYYRGGNRYKIRKFSDLVPVLGQDWHFRGQNALGDFCFVILETVEFYLHKRSPLVEYFPTSDGQVISQRRELGHMLVFTFVRGDGVKEDFGKNTDIFYKK